MKNKEDYRDLDTLLLAEISHTNEINRMKQDRDAIRMQILEHPNVYTKGEGSISNNLGRFKVTTTTRMNRKVMPTEYAEIKEHIPANLNPFKEETVLKLDIPMLRKLAEIEPKLHSYCCRAIEERPGSVGLKVEEDN